MAMEEYRRLMLDDFQELHRGHIAMIDAKREKYAELKAEAIRMKAIERARRPHNRPPWTYTDAPSLVIGDDARVNSEPLDKGSERACGPQGRTRVKPFLKEFAYSTKGNYGGLFDPNIGQLGEGVGKVAADRSRDEEGKGAGEKTRPTPWCTQPLTLDYFDKKMAKESIGSREELKSIRFAELAMAPDRTYDCSMPDFIAGDGGEGKSFWKRPQGRSKQGNKCLEDVQRWQRYHRRSGIRYWEKVERDYRARVRDREKLLKRRMAADAAEREGTGRGEAEETALVDISTTGRTMRFRIAVQIEGSWRRYDVKCDEDETVGDLVERLLERLGCTLKEASILTKPSERRILLAVGDPRHWSGDDRCGDVLSALEAAGVEPVLYLIEKFTAPYQLPVIARSADA